MEYALVPRGYAVGGWGYVVNGLLAKRGSLVVKIDDDMAFDCNLDSSNSLMTATAAIGGRFKDDMALHLHSVYLHM